MSKKYDFDFKEAVIAFYREAKKVPNAKAFRDTIKRFGLNHQTLSRWIREFSDQSMDPGALPVRSDLRQSNINYSEKWDKYREENVRDDYDHIETWPYELTETDLRFLIKQCLAHARHAGGRSYIRLSHVISVLEGRIEKGVG